MKELSMGVSHSRHEQYRESCSCRLIRQSELVASDFWNSGFAYSRGFHIRGLFWAWRVLQVPKVQDSSTFI
ncbi:hypothetical protein DM860_011123 [Cuscuta australis]|uniref:Uncharacterized protein n=1 Tax=Cuscuta australis TaxID=267555 RepID=A0A328D9V1_9ASTE|nr:hypothetical protein DM860_011123 [Cuscuta australis]